MLTTAKRFLAHVLDMRHRLGWTSAIKLAGTFALKQSCEVPICVRINGVSAPIWLRPNGSDIDTFIQVFAQGQYDFSRFPQSHQLLSSYQAMVSSGEVPLIVNCGANIGLSAIWFANRFPRAKIVAIEPAQDNLDMMRKNLAPYQNTEIVAGGVWDEPAELSILNQSVEPWAYQVTRADSAAFADTGRAGHTFKSYTISSIAGRQPILIIKIDIEGSEDALFRFNTDWLNRTHLLIIELHDEKLPGKKSSRNFFCCVAQQDFEFGMNGENAFSLSLNRRAYSGAILLCPPWRSSFTARSSQISRNHS